MVDLYLSKKQVKIVKEATIEIEISLCKYLLSKNCSFVNVNQYIAMKVIPKYFNKCPEMESMPWPGEERGSPANWSGHLSDLLQGVYIFSVDRLISASTETILTGPSLQVDERIPPMVDDFLYVCDDAYS